MELKILVRAVNHLQIPTAQKGSSQCVCVCHPWSHRDAFAFVLPQGTRHLAADLV